MNIVSLWVVIAGPPEDETIVKIEGPGGNAGTVLLPMVFTDHAMAVNSYNLACAELKGRRVTLSHFAPRTIVAEQKP